MNTRDVFVWRWEPTCACGWVGRARIEKADAERTARNHEPRCADSDPRTRIDYRSLASIRRAAER